MFNSKKNKTKKIICSLILCFGMLLSAFAGLKFSDETIIANAINSNISENIYENDKSKWENYNFFTESKSKPATPSGWNELKDDSINEGSIKRGIVDIKDFDSDEYETTNPSMNLTESSNKAYFKNLMINCYDKEKTGRFGYESSSPISLEANSYYSISITLLTQKMTKTIPSETEGEEGTTLHLNPTASIYLTNLLDAEDDDYEKLSDELSFENFTTNGWNTYTFYISTLEAKSINIELWLGSKNDKNGTRGAVFFNEVEIKRYSEDFFVESYSDILEDANNEPNINYINLGNEYIEDAIVNGSFENTTPFGWNKVSNSSPYIDEQFHQIINADSYTYSNGTTTISAPGTNNSAYNEKALFMYNSVDGHQTIESSEIEFEKHTYYRLSFWAKSNCNTGSGATVMLVDKNEKPIESASLTIATNTDTKDKYRNDWVQYNFYIYGPKSGTEKAIIQINLGTAEKQTSGYVFIDDFKLEEISYSTYNSNSSASNSTTFNYNNAENNFVVSNSFFDKTENEENSKVYPLTPAGWKYDCDRENNDGTFSGVISTESSHFTANKSNYTTTDLSLTNPGKLENYYTSDDNNILMIGSAIAPLSQSYTSNNITLSADSYYKISMYVSTQYNKYNGDKNVGARITLATSSITLFDYNNIYISDNSWKKIEIYIKTNTIENTANLKLAFEGVTGYAFFDNVLVETSTENAFKNYDINKNPDYIYEQVDLSRENFDNRTFNSKEKLQTPNNWVGTKVDGSNVSSNTGIITSEHKLFEDIDTPISGNKNVLNISSMSDTYYKYVGKESYTFKAGEYYKITVNILTKNLNKEDQSKNSDFGASFGLESAKDVYFSKINTNGVWKSHSIYVNFTNDTTTSIALALGYADELTSGSALFDNLQITKIDEATFTDEFNTANDDTIKCFINQADDTDEDTTEDTPWENNFDWLIIPSLITALAIIIAVVGFYVRKIKFTKKPKIKTNYDRRKTLDKDIDKRERIALRQRIIAELKEELVSIDKEIEEYNKLAEMQLQEIRNKLAEEQESIKRQKLEIEIRKKELKAEREKQLKDNPELVSNTKAEKDYVNFISKLDKQEMSLQKQLSAKTEKLNKTKEIDNSKLAKFLERKEYIKNEIAKIEAEIEEIAKEEEEMWAEYKAAKADAKKRKAEYKSQVKAEKTKAKATKKSTATKTNTPKETEKVDSSENSDK